MDALLNPYAPGAGYPPPLLAGRDDLVFAAELALTRIRAGRPAKSFVTVGLRGVGKTVVLNKVQQLAEDQGYQAAYIEAHDDIQLTSVLATALRPVLLKLDRMASANDVVQRGLRTLRSFASTFRVSYGGIDLGIDPEAGSADSGDLQSDLPDLFLAIGNAAKARGTAVALIIDEVQYVNEKELSALIMSIHRVNQRELPLIFFGAGLPQLRGKMGEAKSYVERLLDFPTVDALSASDAKRAIAEPAAREGVKFQADALDEIIRVTQGYPYFLQEWGHVVWLRAKHSPIDKRVILDAYPDAIRRLDDSFFRVRLDRMTPTEKKYMRAMAELGGGSHRSGDIAREYGALVTSVAPIRASLIAKGMVYSPAHGDTAFTVPLFDDFMRREMPHGPSAA
jgi:hypothetical protein